MRQLRLVSLFGFVIACGGTDSTIGDGGGGDSSNPGDSSAMDGGSDGNGMQGSCDAGLTSCNGSCVDTASDPMNCGGCGVVCNTTCTKGICQLIAMGCDAGVIGSVGDNACLGVDATAVYWGAGFQNGNVYKLPLGGGCPSVLAMGQNSPHAVASDGTNVFFGDQGQQGSIQRVPVGGGTITPIATNQNNPVEIVLDSANVYWVNSGDGSVWKSDKMTPAPIKLAGPSSMGHATHLRVDSTNVYFTDRASNVVNKVPIAGGNVTALTGTVNNVGYLAIDSKNAYFGASNNNMAGISTVALSAMAAMPMSIFANLPRINGIETDGTNLWYAVISNTPQYTPNSGEIHRVTVGGQNDKVLANMQNGPNCIAVDATSVYWINTGGGMISKTGK